MSFDIKAVSVLSQYFTFIQRRPIRVKTKMYIRITKDVLLVNN